MDGRTITGLGSLHLFGWWSISRYDTATTIYEVGCLHLYSCKSPLQGILMSRVCSAFYPYPWTSILIIWLATAVYFRSGDVALDGALGCLNFSLHHVVMRKLKLEGVSVFSVLIYYVRKSAPQSPKVSQISSIPALEVSHFISAINPSFSFFSKLP